MKSRAKRTEKSQKRTKILFLIILIAAVVSITGTYAWFSTQRDVEIVGFKINVEIAENLEISLDGEKWTHTLNIEDMRQFYGTYIDYDTTTPVYQAVKDDQRNYVPIELLPVSTVGTIENGNLVFVKGEIYEKKLTNIQKCSEEDLTKTATILDKENKNANHPYLAFDAYFKNLSRLSEAGERDPLQLNVDSSVTAAKEKTGLENSVRVAIVVYGNPIELTDTGENARAIEPDGSETVAIWEPNYRLHTDYVENNDPRVSALVEEVETYGIKDNIGTPAAPVVPTEIEDITVTPEDDENLQEVYTNKIPQNEDIENGNLKTLANADGSLPTLLQIDGCTPLSLAPNTITKARIYIWLEGQDPDCVDLASTGDEIIATLRLIKPESGKTGGTSYAEPNANPNPTPTP